MKIVCKQIRVDDYAGEAVVVGIPSNLEGFNFKQNVKFKEFCNDFFANGDFSGKLQETTLLYPHDKLELKRIVLVGLGEIEKFNLQRMRKVIASAAAKVQSKGIKKFAVEINSFIPTKSKAVDVAQAAVESIILSSYNYHQFKNLDETEKSRQQPFDELTIIHDSEVSLDDVQGAVECGRFVAKAVNFARDLQNHPANWLTPTKLAEISEKMADDAGLKFKVLNKPEMEELNMGALLGVTQGTREPPKFIILEHNSDTSNFDTVVLVGKGITFDSGGISLKRSDKMEEMKFDMSGAAAVIGGMQAIAELNLPLHVVALIPAAENLPGGSSMKPGDILTASSGTTIEVINTDAEGRLVLADALHYATRYNPKAVIDLATLTGACVIALGYHAAGLMGNDKNLIEKLKLASETSGEKVWQLPLWEEYQEDIKGDYADIKNSAGRPGGAITAAAFLSKFAENYPWAHLDIAGTAWTDKKQDHQSKGGTGFGVRLLVQFLRDWKNNN